MDKEIRKDLDLDYDVLLESIKTEFLGQDFAGVDLTELNDLQDVVDKHLVDLAPELAAKIMVNAGVTFGEMAPFLERYGIIIEFKADIPLPESGTIDIETGPIPLKDFVLAFARAATAARLVRDNPELLVRDEDIITANGQALLESKAAKKRAVG